MRALFDKAGADDSLVKDFKAYLAKLDVYKKEVANVQFPFGKANDAKAMEAYANGIKAAADKAGLPSLLELGDGAAEAAAGKIDNPEGTVRKWCQIMFSERVSGPLSDHDAGPEIERLTYALIDDYEAKVGGPLLLNYPENSKNEEYLMGFMDDLEKEVLGKAGLTAEEVEDDAVFAKKIHDHACKVHVLDLHGKMEAEHTKIAEEMSACGDDRYVGKGPDYAIIEKHYKELVAEGKMPA